MSAFVTPEPGYDAVVIGSGVGGLVAACYLQRAGARTILLEARETFGGCAGAVAIGEGFEAPLFAQTLYALDPLMVQDLELERHGLAFAQSDMKTVALRPNGEPIVLPGSKLFHQGGFAALSETDTAAYGRFRQSARSFARRLRPLWQGMIEYIDQTRPFTLDTVMDRLRLSPRDADRLVQLTRLSATGLLDRFFENDALKAVLAADSAIGGISPGEAGSALALFWRLAQESCHVQGAVSQPCIGKYGLVAALTAAARESGVALRMAARVSAILAQDERAGGVVLEDGEIVRADTVVSNLDMRATLLGFLPPGAIGLGAAAIIAGQGSVAEAKLAFVLNGPPPFAGLEREHMAARLMAAERPESAAEAKNAALAGRIPTEPIMEVTVPGMVHGPARPEGRHIVSVLLRFLPVSLQGGWAANRELLKKCVIASLERYAPGIGDRVIAAQVLTPDDIARRYGGTAGGVGAPLPRLLSSYGERLRTPLRGLFLCGSAAEPADATCGRAGRLAAAHAVAHIDDLKTARP